MDINEDVPGIPNIASDEPAIGRMAAEYMIGLGFRRILVRPMHVVKRRSTDVFAIDDPEVAAAVNYINQYANSLIQLLSVSFIEFQSLRISTRVAMRSGDQIGTVLRINPV